jgi:hypothetical protein
VVKNGDGFGVYTGDVFSRVYARNNLFLGGPGGEYGGWSSGSGRVIDLAAAAPSCDLDFDGYGSTTGTFEGRYGEVTFASLDELRATTTEVHAIEIGLDDFAAVTYPDEPFPERAIPDLSLAEGSAALDVGVAIPGINSGAVGDGPDLGALERGEEAPEYGPR